MPHALVLAGHGRYEDPWHDPAAISHRLASLLAEDGTDTTIRGTMPGALSDADFDGTDDDWAPFHARLAALVGAGVPVLGLHQAANTFADSPTWTSVLGGRWVEGTSWHPEHGPAAFP